MTIDQEIRAAALVAATQMARKDWSDEDFIGVLENYVVWIKHGVFEKEENE